MAFRDALARLGLGNAGVDVALGSPETTPGGSVSGTVELTGGKVAQDIDEIRVELVTTVRVPHGTPPGGRASPPTPGRSPAGAASSPESNAASRSPSASRCTPRSPPWTAGARTASGSGRARG